MKNHKLIKIKQEKCAKCCSSFQLILHSAHQYKYTETKKGQKTLHIFHPFIFTDYILS